MTLFGFDSYCQLICQALLRLEVTMRPYNDR